MPFNQNLPYSIPKEALIDTMELITNSSTVSSSDVADNRYITLIADADILADELIGLSNGKAVKADYASIKAIGIAITNATVGDSITVQISGLSNIDNNTALVYYLGATGSVRVYSYEVGKYLQRIAYKISDTQILLDFSEFILML